MAERRRDPYIRMARRKGYRSRAAFKLVQLNKRFHFLEGARYVLDLGAAPGGWLQVVAEHLPPDGLAVGVDLKPIRPLGFENVVTLEGDALEEETLERLRRLFPKGVDVVLSDMSPSISGVWELDQYRQLDLARGALRIALELLRPGGWLVVKAFQGSEYEAFFRDVKGSFSYVKAHKPMASRKGSAEIYVVARGPRRGAP
jgi:23S rRNA (uridine2552-2'-O)-methyltransferase